METRATRRDYDDFLLVLYFGRDGLADPKRACVRRAYLDFNRTIHGIGEFPDVYNKAANSIIATISDVPGLAADIDQHGYDEWHQHFCMSLKDTYKHAEFPHFTIGQAQKWINMTLKYIYTFGEIKIPGFISLYGYCHVPLDNIIIDRLTPHGFPKLVQAWGRIDDYQEYLQRQIWIRQTFAMLPLDLELFAWMKPDFNLVGRLRKAPTSDAPAYH
jgi:hypothetical protein